LLKLVGMRVDVANHIRGVLKPFETQIWIAVSV